MTQTAKLKFVHGIHIAPGHSSDGTQTKCEHSSSSQSQSESKKKKEQNFRGLIRRKFQLFSFWWGIAVGDLLSESDCSTADTLNPHLHPQVSFLAWFLAATQSNSWDGRSGSQTWWPHVCKEQPQKEREDEKMPAVVLGRLTAKSNGTSELRSKLQSCIFWGKNLVYITKKQNEMERMGLEDHNDCV